ncbi:unnamed protein product [Linum trigynum]
MVIDQSEPIIRKLTRHKSDGGIFVVEAIHVSKVGIKFGVRQRSHREVTPTNTTLKTLAKFKVVGKIA